MNIAILADGRPSGSELSVRNANEILQMINRSNINGNIIFINGSDWTLQNEMFQNIKINKNDFSLKVNNYARTEFDCVVIAMYGSPAEDGKLAAYFDLINVPYISSGVFASALSFNKYHCNRFLSSMGVLVPKALLYNSSQHLRPAYVASNLTFPLYVKPNSGGLGLGVTNITKVSDLNSAAERAFDVSSEIIIEEFIQGREIVCSLFKTANHEMVFHLSEVIKDEKSANSLGENIIKNKIVTPAVLPEDIEVECQLISSKIYDAINCRGIVSIDFIIHDNRIFFLEINTIPDLSKNGIVAQQIESMGASLSEIVVELINEAVEYSRK